MECTKLIEEYIYDFIFSFSLFLLFLFLFMKNIFFLKGLAKCILYADKQKKKKNPCGCLPTFTPPFKTVEFLYLYEYICIYIYA